MTDEQADLEQQMRNRIRCLANFLRPTREGPARGKYLLMLGAGASYGSGIPRTETLMHEIVQQYGHDRSGSMAAQFDRLWRSAAPTQRSTMLKTYLEGANPSDGYLKLARLIQEGYFDIVFTFNFDNLLERALHQVGCIGVRVIVNGDVIPARIPGLLESSRPQVKILKLHGDVHSEFFAFSSDEVLNYHDKVAQVIADYSRRDVIICGYGFKDPNIVRAFSPEGGAIYYVNPAGVNDNVRGFLVSRKSEDKAIDGTWGRFDDFLEALYQDLSVPGSDPYEQALAALEAHEWDKARDSLAQVPEGHPHHRDARTLLKTLTDLETRYQQGVQAGDAQQWDEAATCFEQIVTTRSDYRDAQARLLQAEEQKRVYALYKQAKQDVRLQEWDRALARFREIQEQYPHYKDVPHMIEELVHLEELYRSGIRAMLLGQWYDAHRLLRQVTSIEPQYKDAKARLAQATSYMPSLDFPSREPAARRLGKDVTRPRQLHPRPRSSQWLPSAALVLLVCVFVGLGAYSIATRSLFWPLIQPTPSPTTPPPGQRSIVLSVVAAPGSTPVPVSTGDSVTVATGQTVFLTAEHPVAPGEILVCSWETSIGRLGDARSCTTAYVAPDVSGDGFVTVIIQVQPSGWQATSSLRISVP